LTTLNAVLLVTVSYRRGGQQYGFPRLAGSLPIPKRTRTMADFSENDWVAPGVLPDWSEIHQNVLAQARITANEMIDKADMLSPGGEDIAVAQGFGKTEFMRIAGFDERFILMITTWIDEQQQMVNQMGNCFLSELESSLEAITTARTHTENDSEEE
jgi:hypothetical protein